MNSQQLESHESCCKIQTTTCPCPICGKTGRRVTSLTLDHHIPPHLRQGFGNEATFCMDPLCNVVYCNSQGKVIRKGETIHPVTIKDPGDDIYVCYCFEHKRGDLRLDLREKGETDIPEKIRQGVKEGRCDCERKNPQGACCLGNVAKAIKEIQSDLSSAKGR